MDQCRPLFISFFVFNIYFVEFTGIGTRIVGVEIEEADRHLGPYYNREKLVELALFIGAIKLFIVRGDEGLQAFYQLVSCFVYEMSKI